MRFREDLKGEIDITDQGGQLTQFTRRLGVPARNVPKMAFSAEPVRKFGDRGHWFELRVEEFYGGEMSLMAMGFTNTDPDCFLDQELPGQAHQIPSSYIAGYKRSTYWDGERLPGEKMFDKLVPHRIFTIGALATPEGTLEIYIDRRLVVTVDPLENDLQPISTDEPLWAVVDACGGLRKASVLSQSLPPQEEEELEEDEVG
mmetsp:Transcript_80274/g.186420  ORF Transcript_80274/g.186420 Transcript_80274/m.186420 type:complete len:202 (-) Transcript_80274:101-706(-)